METDKQRQSDRHTETDKQTQTPEKQTPKDTTGCMHRILPDEMGVGVGVAMSQVHNIVVMREGKCKSEVILRGPLSAYHATLVIADAASNTQPTPTL